jgi:hypothetical protein
MLMIGQFGIESPGLFSSRRDMPYYCLGTFYAHINAKMTLNNNMTRYFREAE